MIVESFDSRTLAAMDFALERACETLAVGGKHETRRYIARKILACARRGDTTLVGLTEAGRLAASEVGARAQASQRPAGTQPCARPPASSRTDPATNQMAR